MRSNRTLRDERRWKLFLIPLTLITSLLIMGSGYSEESAAPAPNGKKVAKVQDDNKPLTELHGCSSNQVAANKELGKKLLKQHQPKWSWPALNSLWEGESKWCHLAKNKKSSAFGIAQFLDATWKPYGRKTRDPEKQIIYGLRYIQDRYGSASEANRFKKANNWY